MKTPTFQSGKIYHIYYKNGFIDGYFYSVNDNFHAMLTRFGEYRKVDFMNKTISMFMLIEENPLHAPVFPHPDFLPFSGWFEGSAIPERTSKGVPSYLVP
jgi:hypothetical protein